MLFFNRKNKDSGFAPKGLFFSFLTGLFGALACLALLSFSCSSTEEASARTAYADNAPAQTIPRDALSVTEALQETFRSVSAMVLPSVVEVDATQTQKVRTPSFSPFEFFFGNPQDQSEGKEREYETKSMGSGFVVRREGKKWYVITNAHVVDGAKEVAIKLADGRDFTAQVVGSDTRKDVALVSFEYDGTDIKIAQLGDSDTVQTGDIVFAVGNPLGYFSSVTQGIVSAVGRDGGPSENINDFIQTDASINQGNSGGPLVNIYGEIIGVNTWIASNSGASIGLGFAIPINNIKSAVDDFISDGKLRYGWLGVSLVSPDKSILSDMGLENRQGAFVAEIFLNSPADKGGILPGDYIIALDGKNVKDVSQLTRDVGNLRAGTTAEFTIIRGGKEITARVKISERDENDVADNSKRWPGFMPYPLSDELKEKLELDKKTSGVYVAGVQARSAGAIMGLQNGDIITSVCGKNVSSLSEFYEATGSATGEIWFDVLREGHTVSTMRYKK